MKSRISSSDVAREAGVSRATVSYVLNNVENVKVRQDTRLKVLDAARKLGYHPDSIAKALRKGMSMCIGVVTRRDVSEERFTKVLSGIKEILSKNGYSILLCSEEENSYGYPEYYSYYREKKVDGILLLSHIESINREQVDKFACKAEKEGIPAVFIDFHINNPMVNCVDINYYHGGYIIAGHIAAKEYAGYLYLHPGVDTIQENERLEGIRKGLFDKGINPEALDVIKVFKDDKENWTKVKDYLEAAGKPVAIITSWVMHGFNTLYYVNKLGFSIPDEVSIVSLAGSSFADVSFPRLTTSDLPLYHMGKKSAEILIKSINEETVPVNMKIPCSLNIRETS